MFEQSQLEIISGKRKMKTISVLIGVTLQTVGLLAMVVLSLIFTEAAPRIRYATFLMGPPAGPSREPQNDPRPAAKRIRTIFIARPAEMQMPAEIPDRLAAVNDPAPPQWEEFREDGGPYVLGGFGSGSESPLPLANNSFSVPPPPVQPMPMEAAPRSVRIGGDVAAARLIRQVKPSYPKLASQARVQGLVKLEAMISETGEIMNLRVLSGHPLLIQSALEAVARWRYHPTLLNGRPVAVITTVDVHFRLGS